MQFLTAVTGMRCMFAATSIFRRWLLLLLHTLLWLLLLLLRRHALWLLLHTRFMRTTGTRSRVRRSTPLFLDGGLAFTHFSLAARFFLGHRSGGSCRGRISSAASLFFGTTQLFVFQTLALAAFVFGT